MSLNLPDLAAMRDIVSRYGLDLSDDDLSEFEPFVHGLLGSWDAVAELYDQNLPPRLEREWQRPADQDNPHNAWYVTCDISDGSDGPLSGMRVAIKDNTMVAGIPMMNGSKTVEGFTPSRDATIVTRLLGAGATIAGKAACEDLCFSGGSHTTRLGPVRNPWDETRSAGGSSCGSGALVASGVVDMATGGDQGGSIRIPAAYSGIVGHKPTFGLVPYTGAFPIEQTIDHVGPMTRTVKDAATMLSAIAGNDGEDPRQPRDLQPEDYVEAIRQGADGLRVGILTEGFGHENSDPGVDEAVRAAANRLTDAGMSVAEVSVPWHRNGPAIWDVIATEGATAQMVDGNGYGMNWKGLYDPECIAHYGRTWREDGGEFSETVKLVLLAGRHAMDTAYGSHYAMAQNLAPRLRAAYDNAMADFDVLVMPTLPVTASIIPDPDAPREEVIARALEMLPNTAPLDVTGHPACSVPAGLVDGLPAGMMIMGRHFHDATVLRVAAAFENLVGGFPTPNAVRAGSNA